MFEFLFRAEAIPILLSSQRMSVAPVLLEKRSFFFFSLAFCALT